MAVAERPDGRNINAGVGSTSAATLGERADVAGVDAAFAFDGDGDRLLAVDATGAVVDGDELIALAARHLRAADRLPGGGVAVTVMTNYGFHQAMAEAGVEVATTGVGDRYVLAELLRRGWALGGEQSGHIIDLGFAPSGDGIASALLVLEALGDESLADRHAMDKLPQVLVNVRVADRRVFADAPDLDAAVEQESAGAGGPRPRAAAPERHRARHARHGRGAYAGRGAGRRRPPVRGRPGPRQLTSSSSRPRTQEVAMCGIVGYVGGRPARGLLLAGLQNLEYRGYDSAGISVLTESETGNRIDSARAVGHLSALRERLEVPAGSGGVAVADAPGTTGIGHTRWATHGRVSEENAHPHFDTTDRVHIVLNGIVENFLALKERLAAAGAEFTSETDAEVVAHLVAEHLDEAGDFTEAVRLAYNELRGHYAFVAMSAEHPDEVVGARKECPLIIGRSDGEQFLASAIPAFLDETRRVQLVNDDEIVTLRRGGVEIRSAAGELLEREETRIDWDAETAEKGGFETFMLKEIHEQADAVAETVADRTVRPDGVDFADELGAITDEVLRTIKRIVIVGCGTAYHAGLVGRYAIEEWARVPVEMDIASEYRYRNPVVGEGDLVVGMTQSGETADTLAAMRLAKQRGAKVLAITNVQGSQATRDADGVLLTRAGLEVGVAATKTFVAQVAAMYLLALRLAELRDTLPTERRTELITAIKRLPHVMELVLRRDAERVEAIAGQLVDEDFFLYLGRHVGLPIALEGALKLKEISYIATDAYAAGEMKHGPIALLEEGTPVVVVATDSPVLDKVVSNVQEVRARGARVIAVGTEGNAELAVHADEVLTRAADRLDARADRRRRPAAAAGLPHRPRPRTQRGQAAQPRQDRHGGVALVGIDLLEVERMERALARRPRLAERLFTDAERALAAGNARRLAARFCAKEAVAKALTLDGWNPREIEVLGGGGPPELFLHGAVAQRASELGVRVEISLTHTDLQAGAVALAVPA